MVARLASGCSLAQAQSQIDAQNANLERDDPQAKMIAEAGFRSLVVPLRADHVASIKPALLLLAAGVFVLLLIAVANLSNLLLVRAFSRAKEIAVRKALGATRGSIVRGVLIESVIIALAGGLLSLGVGAAGIRLLGLLGASTLPMGATISLDTTVAMASLVGAILLWLALAVPVIFVHLRHTDDALRSETRSATAGRGIQFFRHGFVVVQVALAFVLLTGSGLLALSLKQALAVSPGFEPMHVLTGQVSLIGHKYPGPESGLDFGSRLTRMLENQPGVAAAGFVTNVPLSGNTGKSAATVVGHVFQPRESPRGHYSYGVGGDYFKAMGFQFVSGRPLNSDDSRRTERVCVVDEDFARYYWPGQSALGHKLFMGSTAQADNEAFTIVGVVKSVKQAGLTDDAAQGAVYFPYIHRADNNIFIAVRALSRPEQLRRTLERSVREIDPELAVSDIRSMEQRIDESLTGRRSPALLAELFAAIALLLTAIGTYGVLSYTVAQRRGEIGVRMALGARPEQIRNSVRAATVRLFAAGSVLGMVGAWAMAKSLSTMLFHIAPFSVPVLGAAALVMAVIGLAACAIPAWRAARVSPAEALAEL
jgi:predicted permease